jgi:hypothetical protein
MNKVNLNNYVKFKLTNKGNILLEKYRAELSELVGNDVPRDVLIKVDENGYEYMQIWEFMKLFGEHLHNGQTAIVEGNNLYFD